MLSGAPPHPGTEPCLVLIAEDEAPIAETVAMTVQDASYSATVATHGQKALDRARKHPPALVITDLMMPHLDGAELIANISRCYSLVCVRASGSPAISSRSRR